jgi:tetratricopeptide (TPR) repeat protein
LRLEWTFCYIVHVLTAGVAAIHMIKKKTIATGITSAASSDIALKSGPEPPSPVEIQLKLYDQAVHLFSQRKFAEACEMFVRIAKGPAPHIADKARSYAQICERRTSSAEVNLATAEDHFNYGVERLNARDVQLAMYHLNRALAMQPDADHVLYTMALCCGFAGDGNGACENLKRAIDLEPKNRILARQDPEFTALASQFPTLRALLTDSQGIY